MTLAFIAFKDSCLSLTEKRVELCKGCDSRPIIKDFVGNSQHKRAMAMLREICAANPKMTTVVYSAAEEEAECEDFFGPYTTIGHSGQQPRELFHQRMRACALLQYLHFVDEIVKFARVNSGLTIAVCRALTKVCAYCDMYWKACDL